MGARLIEETYLKTNEAALRTLPAPQIALSYYREGEHVKTMAACQKPEALQTFKSPHAIAAAIDIAPSESIKY
jgi:hypothetical protein